MPLLGPEEYKEFGIPYLEKLSRAFGSVHIHCCGEWGRHAANLKKSSAKIRAMEFHYPFTKLEEIEICLLPHAGQIRAALYQSNAILSETIDEYGNSHLKLRISHMDLERIFA